MGVSCIAGGRILYQLSYQGSPKGLLINLMTLPVASSDGSPSTGRLAASYSFEDSFGGPRIFHFPGTAAPTLSHLLSACVLVTQRSPAVYDLMDCNPPSSSVHGILQTRILEWIAIPFSRPLPLPRDRTWVSCTAGRFFTV